jgi:hypothetical protein
MREQRAQEEQRRRRITADPVARLAFVCRRMRTEPDLTLEEERAAREICEVYEAICTGIFTKGAVNLEPTSGGSGLRGLDRMERWHPKTYAAYLFNYRPWSNQCATIRDRIGINLHAAAIDYLWEEVPFAEIERRNHWRHGLARERIRAALKLYCHRAGWLPLDDTVRTLIREDEPC